MVEFNSKITVKLLGYFFLNPTKKHYINELAGLLDLDPGNLFRELKKLEKEGVLLSELSGRERYFSLNKDYPLLGEWKKIYELKYGLVELFKQRLKGLKGLKHAYIFGSYAQGNLSATSDIDLLLVGNHSALEARKMILVLENDLSREINIIDLSPEDFKGRQQREDDFIKRVFKDGVINLV